jgi:hypothetical protein
MQNPNTTQNPAPVQEKPQIAVPVEPQVTNTRPGPYDNYALGSFLLGTISILLSLVIYPGLALGIMSIIFGLRGKQSTTKSKLAKIGIVLGIIGLLSSAFWGVMSLYLAVVSEL